MVAGRPGHDREEIARKLIEWARKEESRNLNGFCCQLEPPINANMVMNWARECIKFREAYEIAKAFLADRRERLLNEGKMHVKAFDLNASVYDIFTQDEKRSQAEFESKLRNTENSTQKENLVTLIESLSKGSMKQNE